MIGMIAGGIGELFVDLFVQDEAAKRAAKAGVWSAAAGAGALLGDASGVWGAGVMVATQGAAMATKDSSGKAVVDAAGSIISGAVTSPLALAKAAGGAAAGAGVGAAVGGEDGAVQGMNLGASFMRGSWVETGVKAGAGLAAGGVAAAVADEEDRGKAFVLGVQIGVAVGGAGAGMAASQSMAVENLELAGEGLDTVKAAVEEAAKEAAEAAKEAAEATKGAANAGKAAANAAKDAAEVAKDVTADAATQAAEVAKQWDAAIREQLASMYAGGVRTLVAEGAAPLAAAAITGDREGESFLDSWQATRGIASSVAGGVAGGLDVTKDGVSLKDAVSLKVVVDTAELVTAGVAVGNLVAERRARARAGNDEDRRKRADEAAGVREKVAEIGDDTRKLVGAIDVEVRQRAKAGQRA